MVETTRLEAGSAESTNSFRGKPQKPDLVTSFFFSAAPSNLSWVIAPKKSKWYSDARGVDVQLQISEKRAPFGKAHFVLTNMSACQNLLENVLLLTRNSENRLLKKEITYKYQEAVLQEKTTSVRSDSFWRLSSPRSPELLPDQRPPSSRHRARKWERDSYC